MINWVVIRVDEGFNKSVHTVPNSDLKQHLLDMDGTCWCHPREDNEYADTWIHNSMDERESYEQGRKLQ